MPDGTSPIDAEVNRVRYLSRHKNPIARAVAPLVAKTDAGRFELEKTEALRNPEKFASGIERDLERAEKEFDQASRDVSDQNILGDLRDELWGNGRETRETKVKQMLERVRTQPAKDFAVNAWGGSGPQIEMIDTQTVTIKRAVEILKNPKKLASVSVTITTAIPPHGTGERTTIALPENEVRTLQEHPERASASYLCLTELRNPQLQRELLVGSGGQKENVISAVKLVLTNGYPPEVLRYLSKKMYYEGENDPVNAVAEYANTMKWGPIT